MNQKSVKRASGSTRSSIQPVIRIDARDVLNRIAQGNSHKVVAKFFGVSTSTISRIVKQSAGSSVSLRRKNRQTISDGIAPIAIAGCIRMLTENEEDLSVGLIAKAFNLSPERAERTARIATIVVESRAGATFQSIAESLVPPMTRERVRQIAMKYGIEPPRKIVNKRRETVCQQALPLIRQGLTSAEIATKLLLPEEDVADLFLFAQKKREKANRTRRETIPVQELVDAIATGRQNRFQHVTSISDRVTIAFIMSGMSSQEVADALKWRYLAAHQTVIGKRTIPEDEFPMIAKVLNVSPEWIATGSPQPEHIIPGTTLETLKQEDKITVKSILHSIDGIAKRSKLTAPFIAKSIRLELGIAPINWTRMLQGTVSPRRYADEIFQVMKRIQAKPETATDTRLKAEKRRRKPKATAARSK